MTTSGDDADEENDLTPLEMLQNEADYLASLEEPPIREIAELLCDVIHELVVAGIGRK